MDAKVIYEFYSTSVAGDWDGWKKMPEEERVKRLTEQGIFQVKRKCQTDSKAYMCGEVWHAVPELGQDNSKWMMGQFEVKMRVRRTIIIPAPKLEKHEADVPARTLGKA